MPIQIGGTGVENVQVGGNSVANVYRGADLIWTADSGVATRDAQQRNISRMFYSNDLSAAVTAPAAWYPFDYHTDIATYIAAGSTMNLVVMDPNGTAPISGTDTITVNGLAGSATDGISTSPVAAVGGFGGVGVRRFAIPSTEGVYNLSNVDGGPGGRSISTSGATGLSSFNFSVTLEGGLAQWVGNGFYSPPSLTNYSIQTIPVNDMNPGASGFYINPIATTDNITYTASRGGLDVTQNIFVTITESIPDWGISWVGMFATRSGSFGVPGDTATNGDNIDVTITRA